MASLSAEPVRAAGYGGMAATALVGYAVQRGWISESAAPQVIVAIGAVIALVAEVVRRKVTPVTKAVAATQEMYALGVEHGKKQTAVLFPPPVEPAPVVFPPLPTNPREV